ncbi:MAG: hypothetical protein HYW07_08710 [Candidatus Latescibacteria bacterium]|nr:hypothetical protein [Candidatus Latescibacterota bacterium]
MPSSSIEILDDDELYRRIHPTFRKPDGTVSSAVFKQRGGDGLSVDFAKLTTIARTLDGHGSSGLASIAVQIPRQLELEVLHGPVPGNYAHGIIKGNITESKAKKMVCSARIVVPVP